jgi:hypothetical protein
VAIDVRDRLLEDSEAFSHEALLYSGDDQFLAGTSAFVRAGVAAGEPVLVVVSGRKIDRLREALGRAADAVHFADMADVGRNPARIIPAWQEFVSRHARPGGRVRGIGEPVYASRTADELIECQLHERLLNLAFAGTRGFRLLCPYDTTALPTAVIEEARRSHPVLASGRHCRHSDAYEGPDGLASSLGAPLPQWPRHTAELRLQGATLDAVRRFVAENAARAGVPARRRVDLVVAAAAIVGESLEAGGGVVRLWTQGGRLVCEIRDRSRLDDPLADRQVPPRDESRVGLLIANQLCDLVQVRRTPGGRVARLHVSRH